MTFEGIDELLRVHFVCAFACYVEIILTILRTRIIIDLFMMKIILTLFRTRSDLQ